MTYTIWMLYFKEKKDIALDFRTFCEIVDKKTLKYQVLTTYGGIFWKPKTFACDWHTVCSNQVINTNYSVLFMKITWRVIKFEKSWFIQTIEYNEK